MENNDIQNKLKKTGETWLIIVKSFRENVSGWPHCKMTPPEFYRRLQREDKLEKQDIIDAFAVVCLIKQGDGRIYKECRDFLCAKMDRELSSWFNTVDENTKFNKVFRYLKQLDDIHSTHINQTVEAIMENRW